MSNLCVNVKKNINFKKAISNFSFYSASKIKSRIVRINSSNSLSFFYLKFISNIVLNNIVIYRSNSKHITLMAKMHRQLFKRFTLLKLWHQIPGYFKFFISFSVANEAQRYIKYSNFFLMTHSLLNFCVMLKQFNLVGDSLFGTNCLVSEFVGKSLSFIYYDFLKVSGIYKFYLKIYRVYIKRNQFALYMHIESRIFNSHKFFFGTMQSSPRAKINLPNTSEYLGDIQIYTKLAFIELFTPADVHFFQILLFQQRRAICNLTFLGNNIIVSLSDFVTGKVYFVQSAIQLGFKGSNCKSRYALSVLLNVCFVKMFALNFKQNVRFNLILSPFINKNYYLFFVSKEITKYFKIVPQIGHKRRFRHFRYLSYFRKRYSSKRALSALHSAIYSIVKKLTSFKVYGRYQVPTLVTLSNHAISDFVRNNLFVLDKGKIEYNLRTVIKQQLYAKIHGTINSSSFLPSSVTIAASYEYTTNIRKLANSVVVSNWITVFISSFIRYRVVAFAFFKINPANSVYLRHSVPIVLSNMFSLNLQQSLHYIFKKRQIIRKFHFQKNFSLIFFNVIYVTVLSAFNGCRARKERKKKIRYRFRAGFVRFSKIKNLNKIARNS